ncbi:MAG: carboxypeptidase-like regulatory domain-containing protein [Planctomycetota bacterium]|jgi:hypothetical protein
MSLHGAAGRRSSKGATDLCVRGRIVDAEGRPLAAARVSSFYTLDDGATAVSAADGSFELSLRSGQTVHLLRVRRRGFAEGKLWLREVDARNAVEISLLAAGGVSGRVISPSGEAIAGAEVSHGACWARSDAKGEFRIDDLPAGSQCLRVFAKGWAAMQVPVQVSPGRIESEVELQLQSGQRIRGRLRDDHGQAIRAALVTAQIPGLRSAARSTFTDGEGCFDLVDLPPDLPAIEFSGPGFATFSAPVPRDSVFLEIEVSRACDEISLQSALEESESTPRTGPVLREDQ